MCAKSDGAYNVIVLFFIQNLDKRNCKDNVISLIIVIKCQSTKNTELLNQIIHVNLTPDYSLFIGHVSDGTYTEFQCLFHRGVLKCTKSKS